MVADALFQAVSSDKSVNTNSVALRFESPFWDKIYCYLGVMLSLVFAFAFSLGAGDFSCLIPDELTKGQTKFVNDFCSGSRGITLLRAMSIFFFGSALFVLAPHILWLRLTGSYLEEFFSTSAKLSRQKNDKSKLFDIDSRKMVKSLIERYTQKNFVFGWYKVKLISQLVFSAIFFLSTVLTYTLDSDAGILRGDYLNCTLTPSVYNRHWFEQINLFCDHGALGNSSSNSYCQNETVLVPCVTSLSALLFPLWVISLILLGLCFIFAICSLLWCFLKAKPNYASQARFLYSICSDLAFYEENSSKMQSDLDFLIVLLSRVDCGAGGAFFDIAKELELEKQYQKADQEHRQCSSEESRMKKRNDAGDFFPEILFQWLKPKEEDNRTFKNGLLIHCGSKGAIHTVGKCIEECLYVVDVNCRVHHFYDEKSSASQPHAVYEYDAEGWQTAFVSKKKLELDADFELQDIGQFLLRQRLVDTSGNRAGVNGSKINLKLEQRRLHRSSFVTRYIGEKFIRGERKLHLPKKMTSFLECLTDKQETDLRLKVFRFPRYSSENESNLLGEAIACAYTKRVIPAVECIVVVLLESFELIAAVKSILWRLLFAAKTDKQARETGMPLLVFCGRSEDVGELLRLVKNINESPFGGIESESAELEIGETATCSFQIAATKVTYKDVN
eukprot:m.156066 g.156066  ORF g.156066 m.156066 type:complete len:674 (+) comp38687_c0_seq14:212-2233(+)